jgi:prolyl-tRNA synthetase
MDALNAALNEDRVAVVHWCQQRECGDLIEEKTNASILGSDVRSMYVPATDGKCIACGKPGKETLVGRAY